METTHANLPWPGFELGSLGPQAFMLPIEQPCFFYLTCLQITYKTPLKEGTQEFLGALNGKTGLETGINQSCISTFLSTDISIVTIFSTI